MEMLQEELPRIRVTITSHYSPDLIEGLRRGALDAAFVRRPLEPSELAFKWLETEPLLAVLPGDHRLAAQPDIALGDLAGETFITVSRTAPTLQCVIAEALRSAGVALAPAHEVDHLTMAISLVASTRGVALLPRYALHFLPAAITSRPLRGAAPTIDLVLGWNPANRSPILRSFLARADGAIAGRARRHQTV
jgi:LysR family hca operon transcriptional activator